MEFLRSVLARDEAVTVSTRVTYDLPVNPLSHIIFTLMFANDTGTITNYSKLVAALTQVQNLAVDFKGTSILNGSLCDLAMMSQTLLRQPFGQVNLNRVNNDVRAISIVLPFGRKLFNPIECFPACKRGDLRLVVDYAAAQTGIDTLYAQIETVELLGATPEKFIKCTTLSKTPTATGDLDVDLPIGNPIVGLLLFSTTVPNTDYTTTINIVKMLVDNVEYGYAEANWESLAGDFQGRFPVNLQNTQHVHENQDGGVASTLREETDIAKMSYYSYLDYDPAGNDDFLLQTEGKSRVHLRINAGDTNALRVLPIELIGVGG